MHAHALVTVCASMHFYPREFAYVYTHKCKCSFLRVFACVRLRACPRTGLIKTQNVFARRKSQLKCTLGSETFRMYYMKDRVELNHVSCFVFIKEIVVFFYIRTYHIVGKFGGNYIWRFGLQPLKLNVGVILIWRFAIAKQNFNT